MAALHATMTNSRGKEVSTTSATRITTTAETWQVRITTTLLADGTYTITVSDRETGVPIEQLSGHYPARQESFVQASLPGID